MINIGLNEIRNLSEEYGNSFYIFNQDEFEMNYKELEDTFRKVYSNYHICYSYKTNYTPAVCECVKRLGGYAEVVSDMEYELAVSIGYKPNKIVFNGPIKGKNLEQHLLNGGINNIDRLEEVDCICSIAENNPERRIKTGIRVNFDIDAGYISRFGIDVEQLKDVIEKLNKHSVIVTGIHCHMSRARGLDAWKKRTEAIISIVDKFKLTNLDYISFGSGMYGKMDDELKRQFPSNIPTYEDYANTVLQPLADYFEHYDQKPMVFTEPGTTLVSKYFDFVGQIEGIKTIRSKTYVLLNCSFHNLGETCQMKNLPIKIFSTGSNVVNVTDSDFVGYTCLEQDILFRGFSGDLSIGDYVLFGNVGGYSIVDKPPFIQPNVPVISAYKNTFRLIKRQEIFSDIFSSYIFER